MKQFPPNLTFAHFFYMPGFAVGRGEETKVAIRKVGVTGSYCWSKEQGLVANTYVAILTRDKCDYYLS